MYNRNYFLSRLSPEHHVGTSLKWCFLLLWGVLLLLFTQSAWAQQVSKWSVKQIQLKASEQYTNPYIETGVKAVFSGPGKQQQTVDGFWNGGNEFVIRFTPVSEGIWTYVTESNDAGLNNQKGSIQCIKNNRGEHGFLRRDEAYRYHFRWDDGTRYFMMGQTYYDLMANAMMGDRWKTAIDSSQYTGMNKVRMQVNAHKKDPKVSYPPSPVFMDTTFNHLNLLHLQKLDEVIGYMQTRSIVADLILFRDFGTITQDERYVRYLVARYAAYTNIMWCLVNEWNYTPKEIEYWNRMGQLVRNTDPWMFNDKLQRLLSVHQQTRIDFQFFDQDWLTHAIIQYGVRNGQNVQGDEWSKEQNKAKYEHGDQWGNKGIVYNLGHNMPVINDEYGYIGEPEDRSASGGKTVAQPIPLSRKKHRQILWGIYTAGGYGSAGDKYQYYKNGKRSTEKFNASLGENDGMPYFSTNWHNPEEYKDIRHLVDFFTTRGLQYWKMAAHNELITKGERVYVLAEPGKQYVLYAAEGGSFFVNLAPGKYSAWRYHPATGKEEIMRKVQGGQKKGFTLPEGEDGVVLLLKETVSR